MDISEIKEYQEEQLEQQIKNLYTYMREREAIRILRAAGNPPPWTKDPILRTWKFTNVKRDHDRTTRGLITEFYEHAKAARRPRLEILFNCAAFRYFGTLEFARDIRWNTPTEQSLDFIKFRARTRKTDGQRVYTTAYITHPETVYSEPKEVTICDQYLRGMLRDARRLVGVGSTWQELIQRLCAVKGFGPFMAKEVALDAMLAGFWSDGGPTDKDTWTPIGPGAKRGVARLAGRGYINGHGKYVSGNFNDEFALSILRRALDAAETNWPVLYPALNMHDIQWALCEFDKYERARLGQGVPRNKFRPSEEALP